MGNEDILLLLKGIGMGMRPLNRHRDEENAISTDWVRSLEALYNAVRGGDYSATKQIIETNPGVAKARITFSRRTALHVAAMAGHMSIVMLLVQTMSPEDLEITDGDGLTALAVAIISNATRSIAECMVGKNAGILTIKGYNMLPVAMAFRYGHKELGRYLYLVSLKECPDCLVRNPQDGATVICNAIYTQSFEVALDLLKKNTDLAITVESCPDSSPRTPVHALANLPSAFLSGCRLRFWQRWLYNSSTCPGNIHTELNNLPIYATLERNMTTGLSLFDDIVPNLATIFDIGFFLFRASQKLFFTMNTGIKDLYDMKLVHDQTSELLIRMCEMAKILDENRMRELHVIEALFLAVERGNVEFVRRMLNANPVLEVIQNEFCGNIFMHAIQFRQPKIFSLIYNFNLKLSAAFAVAYQRNNMLHIAAKLAPNPQLNRIPGAALQMQSELQWFQVIYSLSQSFLSVFFFCFSIVCTELYVIFIFGNEEVKSIVPPWALNQKNLVNNMTPDELFTEDHKQLVIEAEKWMKETATSCTVVGALIITIMFAAAFTVPGGNNQDSGFPIFLNKNTFMIFIISDALSLFSSTTSVLVFLGILTSRYAEQDFLESLPRKLMFGLFALFFSIVSMMVAFCATLLLVLRDRYSWISIPVICLASIPATLFAFMQSRLLVDIFRSTYGGVFDKKAKIWK
nr:uncharacterized protein LOC107433568 [Ziziphus jujuba var. spinosa]